MARHPLKLAFFSLLVCGIWIMLSACGVRNPFEKQSATTRWMAAMVDGDYAEADGLLSGTVVGSWRTETERLEQQHGKVRGVERGDIIVSGGTPFTWLRVTWADGYERCVRVRQISDDLLELLDNGWRDCGSVNIPPTPSSIP